MAGTSGTSPEDTTTAFFRIVEQYQQAGSLGELVQARQEEAHELESQVTSLRSEAEVLTQKRRTLDSAIRAVRDQTLEEVVQTGQKVRELLDSFAREAGKYTELCQTSAELGQWVQAAQALRSGNPEVWRTLSRQVAQHCLVIALEWVQAENRDLPVKPPEAIARGNFFLSYTSLRPSQLLLWALNGTMTEGERSELSARN